MSLLFFLLTMLVGCEVLADVNIDINFNVSAMTVNGSTCNSGQYKCSSVTEDSIVALVGTITRAAGETRDICNARVARVPWTRVDEAPIVFDEIPIMTTIPNAEPSSQPFPDFRVATSWSQTFPDPSAAFFFFSFSYWNSIDAEDLGFRPFEVKLHDWIVTACDGSNVDYTVTSPDLQIDRWIVGFPGQDNCAAAANPTQCDSDSDGMGNHCDCDINNDGSCTSADRTLVENELGGPEVNRSGTDMNCDAVVNQDDLDLWDFKAANPDFSFRTCEGQVGNCPPCTRRNGGGLCVAVNQPDIVAPVVPLPEPKYALFAGIVFLSMLTRIKTWTR